MARLGRGYPVQPRRVRAYGAVVLAAVAATASVSAPAPTLVKGGIPAPVATVAVDAAAPSLAIAFRLDVPAATVSASAPSPALTLGGIPAPTATVSVSAPAPNLNLGGEPLVFGPAAATVSVSAAAPTLTRSALLAPAATVAVSAPAPTLGIEAVGTVTLAPPAATATVSAITPSLNIDGAPREFDAPTATVSVSAPAPGLLTRLQPWTTDESQQATLALDIPDGTLRLETPVAEAPAGVIENAIFGSHQDLAPLVPDSEGRVHADGSHSITEHEIGVPHIWVDGLDVTYFADAPTIIGSWRCSQPGGEEQASVEFPQLTPFHTPGEGDLWWLHVDAPVEIAFVKSDGTRLHQFTGFLVSDETGDDESGIRSEWLIQGITRQADLIGHRVPTFLDPTDIGTLIAKSFNDVPSRRYATFSAPATGIMSRQRGSYSDTEFDYSQGLLSTAWTTGGNQWTIKRTGVAQYAIALKDTTTVHWTVTAGAPGVGTDLRFDQTQACNVIYGRGVGPDGYAWAGWVYPNLLPDDAPIYPNGDLRLIHVGDNDADTDSGTGVSDWQRRMNVIGYSVSVDGTYDSADATAARQVQSDKGLTIDGVLGPQTWAATFDVGSHGGDLSGGYRKPLAIDSPVELYLYAANGAIVGANPAYDSSVIRRERHIDFGTGITKAEATAAAQLELARELDPGWNGTITLLTDPAENSRFLINEGENILLRGFRGEDHLLHIVDVTKDPQSLTVTLTVDSKYRDAMTVTAIRNRDRDAAADPARRPGNVNRRSRQEQDMSAQFDGESGAGLVPRHGVFGGLWTVIRIPLAQVGEVKVVDYTSSSGKFCLAVFGLPILPANLHALVGNPLTQSSPFDASAATLEDQYGWIEAFGQSGDAGGFWPLTESTGSFTGRMRDTGGFGFVSGRPPWIWIAEFCENSSFLEGQFKPAPVI